MFKLGFHLRHNDHISKLKHNAVMSLMCWERLKTQSEGLVPTSDITIINHKLKHNVVMSLLSQWERLKPVL